MTCSPASEVFCDWLDVTFAPDNCPYPDVNRLLLDAGFTSSPTRDYGSSLYSAPAPFRGVIKIDHCSRWARISTSGGCCAALRASGHWMDYLSTLSSSPHSVTRLDASLDRGVDGAVAIQELRSRYPDGSASLGRKALRVKTFLEVRRDGLESGTWYLGHRSRARVTARVYDKALELVSKYGETIPPTTRYEITARSGSGVTLRDAALPNNLFWHVASPALLQAPEGTDVWQPNDDLGWTSPPRAFDAYALLSRRVEALSDLDALTVLADDLGPNGRATLLRLLEKRLASVDASPGRETTAA